MDPNLFIMPDQAITSGAVDVTLFTNTDPYRVQLSLKACSLVSTSADNAAEPVYAILRRVPSGYANPTVTLATGLSSFIDQPDVLGYLVLRTRGGVLYPVPEPFRWLNPSKVFYEGDSLILQMVTPSTTAEASGIFEFGTKTIS